MTDVIDQDDLRAVLRLRRMKEAQREAVIRAVGGSADHVDEPVSNGPQEEPDDRDRASE